MIKIMYLLLVPILLASCNMDEDNSKNPQTDDKNQNSGLYSGGDFLMTDLSVKVGEQPSLVTPEPHLGGHNGDFTTAIYVKLTSGTSIKVSENTTGKFTIAASETPGFENYWVECKYKALVDNKEVTHKSNVFKVNWTN